MDKSYLEEDWTWRDGYSGDEWSSLANGWVVVSRSGMRPATDYETYQYAGWHGRAISLIQQSNLEPQVIFKFGSEDKLLVQQKIAEFTASLALRENVHGALLRVRPFGYLHSFETDAACLPPDISIENGGCIAVIKLHFVAMANKWTLVRSNETPKPDQITSEREPW